MLKNINISSFFICTSLDDIEDADCCSITSDNTAMVDASRRYWNKCCRKQSPQIRPVLGLNIL